MAENSNQKGNFNQHVDPTLGSSTPRLHGDASQILVRQIALLGGFILLFCFCCLLVKRQLLALGEQQLIHSPELNNDEATDDNSEARKAQVEKHLPSSTWKIRNVESKINSVFEMESQSPLDAKLEKAQKNNQNGDVPTCSVCLLEFEEGECLSWSTNTSCQHVFHKPCICSWLLKHKECPMCRNVFLPDADNFGGDGSEDHL